MFKLFDSPNLANSANTPDKNPTPTVFSRTLNAVNSKGTQDRLHRS